jgi:hypothetical protein
VAAKDECDRQRRRHEKLKEGSSPNSQSLPQIAEEQVAGLVDEEVGVVDEEEAVVVGESEQEDQGVEDQPADERRAGDFLPGVFQGFEVDAHGWDSTPGEGSGTINNLFVIKPLSRMAGTCYCPRPVPWGRMAAFLEAHAVGTRTKALSRNPSLRPELRCPLRQTSQNTYRVIVEPNQLGKHMARIEARFYENDFRLRVYFQAATPERVFSRLPGVLRFLQGREEQLWLWGSEASDRSLFFEELLEEAGLMLDRRRDFPRAAVAVGGGARCGPASAATGGAQAPPDRRLAPSVAARRVEVERPSA